MKYPFSFLFESEFFPHARTRRTSLWQKFKDSLNVVYGDMAVTESDEDPEPRLGLFDVLIIPGIIARLNSYNTDYMTRKEFPTGWDKALFVGSAIINFIFNTTPRFLVSVLVALIAFIPITLPVYFISKAVDFFSSENLEKALKLEGMGVLENKEHRSTLEEELTWHNGTSGKSITEHIEKIKCTKVGDDIELYVRHIFHESRTSILKFKYSANNSAVRALFTYNIGGVAQKFPDKAAELSKAETPGLGM